ncbi:unnamed protein product [Trichobilharzia regenti]|nr:unnamed protein product [Trichobilharzia regenti]
MSFMLLMCTISSTNIHFLHTLILLIVFHLLFFLFNFTDAAAVLIPRIDLLISLMGAFAGSVLAFILPASMEIIFLWSERDQIPWFWLNIFTKHVVFILIGLLSLIGGTVATIIQIVEAFTPS